MKAILTLLITLLLTTNVYGNEDIYSLIDQYEISSVQVYPGESIKDIFDEIMKGELNLSYIFNYISNIFFKEIKECSAIFKSIIFISVINGIIASISTQGIGKTASVITYAMTIALCTSSLKLALDTVSITIDNVINITNSSLPVILSLLTLNGYVGGTAIASTLMYSFIAFLNSLIKIIILPCICYYTACTTINSIAPKAMVTRLSEMFYKICIWLLRLTAIAFSTLISLLKIYMTNIDSTATRLAIEGIKIVPVVGDIFSTSIGSAAKLLESVKGGFGLAMVIGIFIITLIPVIKILALMLIYKISAALVEPIGDKAIIELIDSIGNANMLVLITIISVTFMLCIGILILMTGFIGG